MLHVYISGAVAATEANAGVVVHGYNYDIGKWARLEVSVGVGQHDEGLKQRGSLASDGYLPAVVRIGAGGAAIIRTIKINGIDRVGFVLTGSSTISRFDVRASVSTI